MGDICGLITQPQRSLSVFLRLYLATAPCQRSGCRLLAGPQSTPHGDGNHIHTNTNSVSGTTVHLCFYIYGACDPDLCRYWVTSPLSCAALRLSSPCWLVELLARFEVSHMSQTKTMAHTERQKEHGRESVWEKERPRWSESSVRCSYTRSSFFRIFHI